MRAEQLRFQVQRLMPEGVPALVAEPQPGLRLELWLGKNGRNYRRWCARLTDGSGAQSCCYGYKTLREVIDAALRSANLDA